MISAPVAWALSSPYCASGRATSSSSPRCIYTNPCMHEQLYIYIYVSKLIAISMYIWSAHLRPLGAETVSRLCALLSWCELYDMRDIQYIYNNNNDWSARTSQKRFDVELTRVKLITQMVINIIRMPINTKMIPVVVMIEVIIKRRSVKYHSNNNQRYLK